MTTIFNNITKQYLGTDDNKNSLGLTLTGKESP